MLLIPPLFTLPEDVVSIIVSHLDKEDREEFAKAVKGTLFESVVHLAVTHTPLPPIPEHVHVPSGIVNWANIDRYMITYSRIEHMERERLRRLYVPHWVDFDSSKS